MTPLFSIIIPSFNRAHLIPETLESVANQTYENWECIIIDDGSTDTTEEVVSQIAVKDNRFKFFSRPNSKPKGANSCRNYGFEISSGEYINWLDSDDLLLPEHIAFHIEQHKMASKDAVITSAQVFSESTNNVIREWNVEDSGDILNEFINTTVLWPINCVSWKRESVAIIPFDERLSSSQDWTFHLSQLIIGRNYIAQNKPTCLVRSHAERIGGNVSEQKSFSTFTSRMEILNLLKKSNKLNKSAERGLLKFIFTGLRQAINNHYYALSMKIISFLTKQCLISKNKSEILKILLIAVPTYTITGKGEKLFNI